MSEPTNTNGLSRKKHTRLTSHIGAQGQKSPKRGSIRRLCANGIDCGACAACLGYVMTTSDRWSILYAKIWTQRPSMGSDPTYRYCWPTRIIGDFPLGLEMEGIRCIRQAPLTYMKTTANERTNKHQRPVQEETYSTHIAHRGPGPKITQAR